MIPQSVRTLRTPTCPTDIRLLGNARSSRSFAARIRSKKGWQQTCASFLWEQDEFPVAVDGFKAPKGSTLTHYATNDGLWHIRPAREEELPAIAELQAQSFYEPLPLLGPLNKPLLYGFQAEVLSVVRTKTSYGPRDGFQCLVAEEARHPGRIVGVVEVSLQSGKDELAALEQEGFRELMYAYVACMAVHEDFRRNGIASELLKAAEIQAGRWKQNWVLLHVYIDNKAGTRLYSGGGYTEIYNDPEWQKYLGRRRRFLLAKQAAVTGAAGAISSISQNVLQMWKKGKENHW